eukprot:bmy_21999T0
MLTCLPSLCVTQSLPFCYVDTVIPCSDKEAHSVGLMWWRLVQEVLCRLLAGRAKKAVTVEAFQANELLQLLTLLLLNLRLQAGLKASMCPLCLSAEHWSAQPATEGWPAAPTAQDTEWVGTTTGWS